MVYPVAACRGRTNVASSAWTPLSLSSLLLWMDASFGVYSDGGTTPAVAGSSTVQQWNSRAGTTTVGSQATSGRRMAYAVGANGKYYMNPDGSDDCITTDFSTDIGRNVTVGVLFDGTDGGSHDTFASVVSKNPNSALDGWLLGYDGTSKRFGVTLPSFGLLAGSAGDIADGWHTGILTISAAATATYTVYVDNVQVGTASTSFGPEALASTLAIGCSSAATPTAGNWKRGIGDIVIASGVLSSDDRGLLHDFLSSKTPT